MNWRYQETVLTLIVIGNVSLLAARFAISPVVPMIIETFSVSKSAVGVALTGMWAMTALFQFPSGVLGDRYGERRVVFVSLGVVGVASILLALSPSFVLFGVFAVVLGMGTGLFFPAAGALLTRLYANTGLAFGFLTAGAGIAGLIVPVAAAAIAVRVGWRSALLLGAVGTFPALVAIAWRVRPTPPAAPTGSLLQQLRPDERLTILVRPPVAYSIAVAVAGAFTFQAITGFFPTFLVEYRGYSTQQAGFLFGVIFLLSALGQPVVGRLSDAFGRDRVIAVTMTTVAVGIGVILLGSTHLVTQAAIVVIGAGFTWFGVVNARIMDTLSATERVVGFGLARTVFLLLASLGSIVTGVVADVVGWVPAYGIVICLLVVTAATLLARHHLDLDL